ncbi:tyrosine-type recombinase/integrase [Mycolicibacterium xanthum]|uniref:tyrosine-type recombinase/integrase n=1 Tax=Mycolicibacterium xanthum TaxID=2796469 RepID=UPI0027DFB97B|nr:site-specific integrase [Mycolicibacterium xanthum]
MLFTIDGRQTSVSFTDLVTAEKFRALATAIGGQEAMKAYDIPDTVRAAPQGLTVSEWLQHHCDHLTGAHEGTLSRYRAYAANDIGPVLGEIPLRQLHRDQVAQWLKGLHGNAVKTQANKLRYLSGAMNAAVDAGHITANPCRGVKLPRGQEPEAAFLTREEFATLLAEIPQYWQPLVRFLVSSGCRWGEATALRPSDIDRENNTVSIRRAWRSVNGGWEIGPPKSRKSTRLINVPASVLDTLDYSHEYVFTNSGRGNRGTGPVRLPSFSGKVWTPAVERAGMRVRIHDLRHTCASWLIAARVALPAVQAHLGHESIKTTVDRYGHLDRSQFQAVSDAIEAALS